MVNITLVTIRRNKNINNPTKELDSGRSIGMGNNVNFSLTTDIRFCKACTSLLSWCRQPNLERGGRAGVCEDFSLNLLCHWFYIFRSNASTYSKLSESRITEIHRYTMEGFGVLTLKFAFLILEGILCSRFLFVLKYIHFFDLEEFHV